MMWVRRSKTYPMKHIYHLILENHRFSQTNALAISCIDMIPKHVLIPDMNSGQSNISATVPG
jgi:hypothetical protein